MSDSCDDSYMAAALFLVGLIMGILSSTITFLHIDYKERERQRQITAAHKRHVLEEDALNTATASDASGDENEVIYPPQINAPQLRHPKPTSLYGALLINDNLNNNIVASAPAFDFTEKYNKV